MTLPFRFGSESALRILWKLVDAAHQQRPYAFADGMGGLPDFIVDPVVAGCAASGQYLFSKENQP